MYLRSFVLMQCTGKNCVGFLLSLVWVSVPLNIVPLFIIIYPLPVPNIKLWLSVIMMSDCHFVSQDLNWSVCKPVSKWQVLTAMCCMKLLKSKLQGHTDRKQVIIRCWIIVNDWLMIIRSTSSLWIMFVDCTLKCPLSNFVVYCLQVTKWDGVGKNIICIQILVGKLWSLSAFCHDLIFFYKLVQLSRGDYTEIKPHRPRTADEIYSRLQPPWHVVREVIPHTAQEVNNLGLKIFYYY